MVSKERNEGGSSSRVLPIPETEFLLSNSSTRVLRDVAREAGVKVEELPLLPMQKEGRKEGRKRREEKRDWCGRMMGEIGRMEKMERRNRQRGA